MYSTWFTTPLRIPKENTSNCINKERPRPRIIYSREVTKDFCPFASNIYLSVGRHKLQWTYSSIQLFVNEPRHALMHRSSASSPKLAQRILIMRLFFAAYV